MSERKCCYDRPRDFSALRNRIAEHYQYEYQFAEKLGMTKQCLSRKMKSITPFTVDDICKIAEALHLEDADLDAYFRTPLVFVEEQKGLRAIIKEKCGNEASLARAINMRKNVLCHRLNFKTDFRYSELVAMAKALQISIGELAELLEIERGKLDAQGT